MFGRLIQLADCRFHRLLGASGTSRVFAQRLRVCLEKACRSCELFSSMSRYYLGAQRLPTQPVPLINALALAQEQKASHRLV